MDELHVTHEGRRVVAVPGDELTVGRSAESGFVVSDPTVSRQHGRLVWTSDGWIFESAGRAGTFRHGEPVTRMLVTGPVDLALASPEGPVIRLEPVRAIDPQVTQGPGTPVPGAGTEPAGPATPPLGSPAPAPPLTEDAALGAGQPPPGIVPGLATPAGGEQPRRVNVRVASARHAGGQDDLATAFQILVPIQSWLKNPGWRQGTRLLVIIYGLLPLFFIALFSSSHNLTTPGWAYSLYIAPLWAIVFWLLIRPGPVGRQEQLIAAATVVWTLVWMQVVTSPIDDHLHPKSFGDALAVGFNEEVTKALPILLAALALLRWRSVKLDLRMWMFLGTIAGLTFGVREQALYTPQGIAQTAAGVLLHRFNLAVSGELFFAYRVFVDGFQHAVWAGVAGFFMGMAVNYSRRRFQLVILGVTIPAVLHALNDWTVSNFNSYWPWILLQAFSLLLFLGYTMSAASIEHEVRRTPMFRGESMLMERFSEPGDPQAR